MWRVMKLKINRQREENTDVQEERKKEVKQINAAGMSVPKMMGLETGNVCICVCVLIIEVMDGGMERTIMWVRAAADEEG